MRHLTLADYRRMPWANGRGTTVEMMRVDGPDGLLWRLSMASVVEDGPFSVLPRVERNLTVISGPGFRLEGDGVAIDCAPLVPVAFAGDIPVRAVGTGGFASADFNVMTARSLVRAVVTVEHDGSVLAAGGTLCLFALGDACADDLVLARHDLLICETAVTLTGCGPVIVTRLFFQ